MKGRWGGAKLEEIIIINGLPFLILFFTFFIKTISQILKTVINNSGLNKNEIWGKSFVRPAVRLRQISHIFLSSLSLSYTAALI
jgi:hypothetical protein